MRQLKAFVRRDFGVVAASAVLAVTAVIRSATPIASVPATLLDLESPRQLRAAFNQDVGKTRVILLVSPTWPACVDGARWVQRTLLDTNPNAPVRIYAVWFKMYPGDARDRWRSTLLDDPRFVHFWDDARAMGRLFFTYLPTLAAQHVSSSIAIEGDILWDAYLLYGPEAQWKDDDMTVGVASWGSTILATQEDFLRDFLTMIARHSRGLNPNQHAQLGVLSVASLN